MVPGATWYATSGLVMTLISGVVGPGMKITYKILNRTI
jgi:hypothetical protein